MNIKKYIGSRAFYKSVLALTFPVIVQNGISNFVNLLDNVMVGSLGTEPLSGVAIVNQLIFVYMLMLFGGISGAGIFTAQFFGRRDDEGVRYTFRFKLYTAVLLTALGMAVIWCFRDGLISLFLTEDNSGADPALALMYGKEYIGIALLALIPTALTQVYASTLRETEHTVVPMVASVAAVIVNGVFNYVFIFGAFGIPAMGVRGAAIGTIIARCTELLIVLLWTHLHSGKVPYIKGAYRSFYIPGRLAGQITLKGAPLVGSLLGAGKIEEAKDTDRKLIAFSCAVSVGIGIIMASFSHVFTLFYDVSEQVRQLAVYMMIISSAMMPFNSYVHNCYFTLRSGGQTMITFLFDCVFVWCISVPTALLLSRCTDLDILPLYAICVCLDIIKCVIGFFMLRSGKWAKKLV